MNYRILYNFNADVARFCCDYQEEDELNNQLIVFTSGFRWNGSKNYDERFFCIEVELLKKANPGHFYLIKFLRPCCFKEFNKLGLKQILTPDRGIYLITDELISDLTPI